MIKKGILFYLTFHSSKKYIEEMSDSKSEYEYASLSECYSEDSDDYYSDS